jgi:RNA polymerase sigma-32 factor
MGQAIEPATSRYITMVNRMPLLPREQELELARAFLERGDRTAADRLIAANLRHVVPHALRYRHMGVPFADLIAQGNLGLMLALRGFDPSRGLRFATYANHWVRSEMLAFALKTRNLVGGGRGALRAKYALHMRRAHAHLQSRLGDDAEVRRILGDQYNKTPDEIASILHQVDQRDASLDAPNARSGERSMLDQLAHGESGQEEALSLSRSRTEFTDAVAKAMTGLDERERYIVESRMMADDETRLSLSDIGRRFGVSRERARQIETKAKAKLRQRLAGLADRWSLSSAA